MAVIGNNNVISMWMTETDYWANRSSNQWGEISSAYRLTVTPKRSDSKIVFECSLPNQTVTHHGLNHYRIYNVTDGAVVNEPQAHINRSRDHAPSRGQYNADNAVMHCLRAALPSWGTSAAIFTLHSMSYANDLTRHNHSAGNSNVTVHWNSHMFAYAYEIEDI